MNLFLQCLQRFPVVFFASCAFGFSWFSVTVTLESAYMYIYIYPLNVTGPEMLHEVEGKKRMDG